MNRETELNIPEPPVREQDVTSPRDVKGGPSLQLQSWMGEQEGRGYRCGGFGSCI